MMAVSAAADVLSPVAQHQLVRNAPHLWQSFARDFISAANHLDRRAWRAIMRSFKTKRSANSRRRRAPNPMVPQVLYAIALENMLKGLLIARGHRLFDPNDKLVGKYRTHNLLAFASEAGLTLSVAERALVDRLARAITEGKFLVPLAPKPRLRDMGKRASSSDRVAICRLLGRIEDEMRTCGLALPRRDLAKL